MEFTRRHLEETARIAQTIDAGAIERLAILLSLVRARGGRLFVLGVGGSAANASHLAADFRKLAAFEAYAPADNIAELTARINDDGWESALVASLRSSRLRADDAVLLLSVGGGSVERNISANLVAAADFAKDLGATIVAIVGRDGGYAAKIADACVVVPTVNADVVTPHVEAFQAVVWHLLVSHPALSMAAPKWESTR
jgi:D-sedoheptulose 7-phosphate isomerase